LAKSPATKPAKAKAPSASGDAIANRERPATPVPYKASKEELLEFYKQMLLIRRLAGWAIGPRAIGGFALIGREAVAIGLQSALTPARTV
jgi:pyruvate dehydrogenase E1 component alpha subunit